MMLVKTVILTTALLCASSVHALEVTGMNDVKSIDSGMSARLAAIVAVINDLKTKFTALETLVNGFAARITATETNITTIKNNGANNEVQAWNPKLETRLDAIETNITSIKGNGANNEVSAWNPKLETRLDAVEALNGTQNTRLTALEGKSSGVLKFVRTVAYSPTSAEPSSLSTSPAYSYDLCALADVGAQTVEDNHGHRCKLDVTAGTNANTYRMSGYSRRMTTQCAMNCYNY